MVSGTVEGVCRAAGQRGKDFGRGKASGVSRRIQDSLRICVQKSLSALTAGACCDEIRFMRVPEFTALVPETQFCHRNATQHAFTRKS